MSARPNDITTAEIPGERIIALLHELGVDDWKAVQDIHLTPPNLLTVTYCLRDEKGHFYLDREANDVARGAVVAKVVWPA